MEGSRSLPAAPEGNSLVLALGLNSWQLKSRWLTRGAREVTNTKFPNMKNNLYKNLKESSSVPGKTGDLSTCVSMSPEAQPDNAWWDHW